MPINHHIFNDVLLNVSDMDFFVLEFCRPLIIKPDLPNRWIEGQGAPLTKRVFCNSCLSNISTGGLHCIRKERQEKRKKDQKILKNLLN